MKSTTINKSLNEIASIRFGLHIPQDAEGERRDFHYLQAKQFDNRGKLLYKSESSIPFDAKLESHLLMDGDVVFAGKGNRNFAWCYRKEFGGALASSIFYVLTPNQKLIYPEYLAAYLNLPQSQTYFQQLGGGTSIPSIRKSELGVFSVPILPLAQQQAVVEISNLHDQEIQILQKLMSLKINHFKAIISKITQ